MLKTENRGTWLNSVEGAMNVSGKLSWFAHFMNERTENGNERV